MSCTSQLGKLSGWTSHANQVYDWLFQMRLAQADCFQDGCKRVNPDNCQNNLLTSSQGQILPQVDDMEAIKDSPWLHTRKQVESFVGLEGWWCRWNPQTATLAAHLNNLTSKMTSNPVKWAGECESIFQDFICAMFQIHIFQSNEKCWFVSIWKQIGSFPFASSVSNWTSSLQICQTCGISGNPFSLKK